MTSNMIARLSALLRGAIVLAFLVILVGAAQRSLWFDELMAMVNYPVRSLAGLVDPLPYYSQAAPPLFNLICSGVALLPPVAARLMLALIVTAGLSIAVARTHGARASLPIVALFAALVPSLAIYATELKYYGIEIAGTAIIAAWFVTRSRRAPFAARDVFILGAAMICGISSILIAGIATGLWALLAFARRRRFAASEWAWAALLVALAIIYYALIRHGTAIQMHNFPNAYGERGLRAALSVPVAMLGLFGNRAPILGLILLINLAGWRTTATRKLLLIVATILLACALLAAVGAYPATAPRHVAWFDGLALLLLANAIHILVAAWPKLGRVPQAALALFLAAIVTAATGMTIAKALTTHFAHEENDRIVAWLARPRAEPIALWGGTQPLIEYYRRWEPAVGRHDMVGLADPRSAPVPPHMLSPAFLRQPPDRIAAAIEAGQTRPGGYDQRIVYLLLHDYRGAAATLLAEAPRGVPFHIVASHGDWDAAVPLSIEPRTALLSALNAAQCRHRLTLKATEAYVLAAICPRP